MRDYGLTPRPSQWALDAGLPGPAEDEGFCEYVTRLGLDCAELLHGLDRRTVSLANVRLSTKLQRDMPLDFTRHIHALVDKHRPTPMA